MDGRVGWSGEWEMKRRSGRTELMFSSRPGPWRGCSRPCAGFCSLPLLSPKLCKGSRPRLGTHAIGTLQCCPLPPANIGTRGKNMQTLCQASLDPAIGTSPALSERRVHATTRASCPRRRTRVLLTGRLAVSAKSSPRPASLYHISTAIVTACGPWHEKSGMTSRREPNRKRRTRLLLGYQSTNSDH